MNIILAIINIFFALFLPGFILSFVFFKKDSIDVIERFVTSIALSIAVVPLLIFYTNLLGIKITSITVIIEIIMILLISLALLVLKQITNKNSQNS